MPARIAPLPLLLAAALAGCLAPAALDPTGALAPAASPAQPLAWTLLPTGFRGGEPSIGVAASGTMFLAGAFPGTFPGPPENPHGTRLIRSTDGGATWAYVGDLPTDPRFNFDPWMWLDPSTDRVYNAPLGPACTQMQWTDDEGATWQGNPAVACIPPSHDHQKLVTGPPPAGVATVGYPNVVWYAYNSLLVTGTTGILGVPGVADARLGTVVASSLDGGLTFGAGRIIHESGCHRGIIGPPAVAADGRVFIPHGTCDGVDVMTSGDGGATWSTASINDVGSLDDFAFDPGVAVDSDGTAHLVWQGRDALLHHSTSDDGGATWSQPRRITPDGMTVTVYSSLVAGAAGRAAVAYAATSADPSGWEQRASSFAPKDATWHLYVTFLDQGTPATVRITPEDDPLQQGCIWMRGGSNDCRNLLDFVTLFHRDGTLWLAYTDGCERCPPGQQSQGSDLMIAVAPWV